MKSEFIGFQQTAQIDFRDCRGVSKTRFYNFADLLSELNYFQRSESHAQIKLNLLNVSYVGFGQSFCQIEIENTRKNWGKLTGKVLFPFSVYTFWRRIHNSPNLYLKHEFVFQICGIPIMLMGFERGYSTQMKFGPGSGCRYSDRMDMKYKYYHVDRVLESRTKRGY